MRRVLFLPAHTKLVKLGGLDNKGWLQLDTIGRARGGRILPAATSFSNGD